MLQYFLQYSYDLLFLSNKKLERKISIGKIDAINEGKFMKEWKKL